MNQLEELFVTMIEHNKNDFYRLALSYVKNEANALDMIGEATCKAMTSLARVREPEYLKTWYYRILINTCKTFIRKNKNLVYGEDIFMHLSAPLEVHEEWIDLHEAVHKLPVKYRDVIVLKYFNQLSIEETACMLNCKPNTVKSLLRRGIIKLQQSMGGANNG